jgi:hypothetical protein
MVQILSPRPFASPLNTSNPTSLPVPEFGAFSLGRQFVRDGSYAGSHEHVPLQREVSSSDFSLFWGHVESP